VKRIWLASIAFIAQLPACLSVAGTCVPPPPFGQAIPDGASASREAMLSTQRTLKAYDNAVMVYTLCLRDFGQSTHDADTADMALRQLALRFNEELKIFKERNRAD